PDARLERPGTGSPHRGRIRCPGAVATGRQVLARHALKGLRPPLHHHPFFPVPRPPTRMYTTAFLDLPPLLSAGGTVRLPGSRSISNRVLLLAGLSEGTTVVHDLLA